MSPSPVTGKLYSPDCIGRLHKNLLKKAGITENIPFHGLRHSYAVAALRSRDDMMIMVSLSLKCPRQNKIQVRSKTRGIKQQHPGACP